MFLDKGDIQVAHKDPRALLARIETIYWQCWLLVAYAPHTGLPLGQREQWWTSLAELAHRRGRDEQMIVLLDANAAPGPRDDIAVFTTGLPESANTPLFRGLLKNMGSSFRAQHQLIMATSLHGQIPQGHIATA